MTAPMTEALPYGIRDLKLTPYADAAGLVLGDESFDLPNMQTLSFSETEEFQELRGDDRIVTTRGRGAQVEWDLEAGGISVQVWAVLTGGEIIESGTLPNRKITMRKRGSDARPFFRIDGQSISDSGGDIRVIIYRCRANASIEGQFADGEFFVTRASGLGLPLLDDTNDLLYDIVHNEQKSAISLTPDPNPLPAPQNVSVGTLTATSAALNWDPSSQADSYKVQRSADGGTTWTAVTAGNGGEPTSASTTVAGLTASTQYVFRVAGVFDTVTGPYSTPTGAVTTPAS